jgi:hypothetical protein
MKTMDFTVTGEPAAAKSAATQALEGNKFRLTWHDDWTATAERGSKTKNFFGGAFAQYIRLGVEIRTAEGAQSLVRLGQETKGYMGGALGVRKTNKTMAELRDQLSQSFQTQGVFVGVTETG